MRLDDDLSHLERQIAVVCENGKCTRQAVYIVRMHPMDHCNVPGLDVRGDRVFTFCPKCIITVAVRLCFILSEANGSIVRCKTCGRHVEKLHDVYQVEKLVRR